MSAPVAPLRAAAATSASRPRVPVRSVVAPAVVSRAKTQQSLLRPASIQPLLLPTTTTTPIRHARRIVRPSLSSAAAAAASSSGAISSSDEHAFGPGTGRLPRGELPGFAQIVREAKVDLRAAFASFLSRNDDPAVGGDNDGGRGNSSAADGGDDAALQKPAAEGKKKTAMGNSKFFPMVMLFFFMSFNNTILDSLGNSLVITASGGGTHVIPFLTVYAVWPCSFLFLLAYSAATQRLSRQALFNAVLGAFLAFYAAFGFAYPNHDALHFGEQAASAAAALPAGLAGFVGMVRNWSFTLFYCSAELWGDVVLSLLFWGLANETTALDEAPALYPMFGLGANVGQAVSGKALALFHRATDGAMSDGAQVQALMAAVVACGGVVLALHAYIVGRWPLEGSRAAARKERKRREREGREREVADGVAAADAAAAAAVAPAAPAPRQTQRQREEERRDDPPPPSLKQAFAFLAASPQIRCLAVMALSQGLAGNLVEIAWKGHVHLLHPSPSAYSAVMGDVAMWTGLVTGSLMLLSPTLFRLWRWHGVAGATPRFMLAAGLPFFAGSALFAFLYPASTFASKIGPSVAAVASLKALVAVGALLLVFYKGAKFSMFKPAEEMVYIGLDEQSRTKGKAAIDVAGAQTGKSVGSVLQQVVLVASAGSMAAALPVMALAFFGILTAWKRSVDTLDTLHVCAFSSADEEAEGGEGGEEGGMEGNGGGLEAEAAAAAAPLGV